MILYADTSAFVPLLIDEAGTPQALRLWATADRVVSSHLLVVETSAALALARRVGRLDADELARALAAAAVLTDDIDVVEVTSSLVHRAAELAVVLNLRGYDAVHCASAELCADGDLVVAAGDHVLLTACANLGLATAPVG